jgi:hypothetical protein
MDGRKEEWRDGGWLLCPDMLCAVDGRRGEEV